MNRDIPHLRIIVAVCCVAVGGYGFFSAYAVIWLRDATMTGDIIGTWKSFAVLAFGFWLGSSSGGKAKDESSARIAERAAGLPSREPQQVTIISDPGAAPQEVQVMNQPGDAVPTTDEPRP